VLPGGAVRWIAARGQVEFGGNRKPLRMRGVSIDITERRQAEMETQELRRSLAHSHGGCEIRDRSDSRWQDCSALARLSSEPC